MTTHEAEQTFPAWVPVSVIWKSSVIFLVVGRQMVASFSHFQNYIYIVVSLCVEKCDHGGSLPLAWHLGQYALKSYCCACCAAVNELRGQDDATSCNKPMREEAIVFAFIVKDVHLQLLEQKQFSRLETHPGTYAIPPAAALVLHHAQWHNVLFDHPCSAFSQDIMTTVPLRRYD